jgi:tetratricopeptide (TPR) repeat protein
LLEELVRAHAADPDAVDLPDGVLALVETKLERLPRESRRILRAASVFGRSFWAGGVEALLGGTPDAPASTNDLDALRQREVIVVSPSTRFEGQVEYAFASALLQDAVYATLTEADRAIGHRLAAAWLDGAGEHDARLLAEHFERGGDFEVAALRFRDAAIDALAGNAFADAIALSTRARACFTRPEVATQAPGLVARLWTLEAEASLYLGPIGAEGAAREALAAASPGSSVAFDATGAAMVAIARRGGEGIDELATDLEGIEPTPDARRAAALCLARAVTALVHVGRLEPAERLLQRCGELALPYWQDPLVFGRVAMARARLMRAKGDVAGYVAVASEALDAIDRAGDRRTAANCRVALGSAHLDVGALEAGEAVLRDGLRDAEAVGCRSVAGYALLNLGNLADCRGDFEEATGFYRRALNLALRAEDPRLEAHARSGIAAGALGCGRSGDARDELVRARAVAEPFPDARIPVAVIAVRLELAEGRASAAADLAMDARAESAEAETDARLALSCVDALNAAGRDDAARDVLDRARKTVLERAARIADPAARRSFLERIPEHGKILALGVRAIEDRGHD